MYLIFWVYIDADVPSLFVLRFAGDIWDSFYLFMVNNKNVFDIPRRARAYIKSKVSEDFSSFFLCFRNNVEKFLFIYEKYKKTFIQNQENSSEKKKKVTKFFFLKIPILHCVLCFYFYGHNFGCRWCFSSIQFRWKLIWGHKVNRKGII